MYFPIYYFFRLVLDVFIDFPSDAIHESSEFFKAAIKKDLKFVSSDGNACFTFELTLVLLPIEKGLILEE